MPPRVLAYDLEAIGYPDDEPESQTEHLVGLLSEIASQRLDMSGRPEPDPQYPEIGRYRELAHAVECLIDCAGQPFPDYRERLVAIAALALDAAMARDNSQDEASVLAAVEPS